MSAKSALALATAALLPSAAFAGSYTFTDTGLQSLAHGAAYTWGLSATQNSNGTTLGALETVLKGDKTIGSVTLTISGLYDWTVEPADVLYVNILNNVKPGNASYTYDSSPNTHDTVFGKDIFDTVTKPTAPVAPVAPTKPTDTKPTAPAKVTLTKPTAPTPPTLVLPTPPTPLGPNPTTAQKNAYNSALATYNTKLAAYNAAQATYATALATYNTKLAAYNAAQAAYATALATYNTNLATYNANQAAYTAAQTAYTAALATYNTNLTTYNAALVTYNNYVNTQAALGFTGVSPTPVPGSLYNQADSLIVANTPNGPGTWTDLNGPAGVTNLTITLSAANISLLEALLSSDSPTTDLGLGFGPDCHFYDTKVTLVVTTVPEQGMTLALVGFALVALAAISRFAKRSVRS